ncbi:MAG TPA: XdhC family protein [Bacteroidales bacterium]|nr:XdhC family protein [Bacteroidales bacterium]
MAKIFKYLSEHKNRGEHLVLGVIIETMGSAPQVPGASAIFSADGIEMGTLGGGLLEFEARRKAKCIIGSETSSLFTYHLNADISESKGAICGGQARILLDTTWHKDLSVFSEMERSFVRNKAGVLVTYIAGVKGEKASLTRRWYEDGLLSGPVTGLPSWLSGRNILSSYETRTTGIVKAEDTETFQNSVVDLVYLEPLFPAPELVIVGAGHIGRALSHLGSLLDFEVIVIDDRPDYANRIELPDADRIITDNIEDAVGSLKITPDTYIVIVTTGHINDATALRQCIDSKAAYIGMIGSNRKIALMKKEFLERGWATENQFNKVHAPIGLPIMSKTIQEITVSIAAEIIQVRRQKQVIARDISIWSVILAAGEARRMKKQKLLLPYGRESIIGTIVQRNLDSKADEVLVVLGSDHERLMEALKGFKIHTIINEDYRKGMLSSVQKGIRALPEKVSAAIIFLGDQPMIQSWVIDKLIDTFVSKSKRIIIPVNDGKRGHPMLLDRRYFREILNLGGKESLHTIISNHHEDIFEIEVNTTDILRDIDTIDEYENELNQSN